KRVEYRESPGGNDQAVCQWSGSNTMAMASNGQRSRISRMALPKHSRPRSVVRIGARSSVTIVKKYVPPATKYRRYFGICATIIDGSRRGNALDSKANHVTSRVGHAFQPVSGCKPEAIGRRCGRRMPNRPTMKGKSRAIDGSQRPS